MEVVIGEPAVFRPLGDNIPRLRSGKFNDLAAVFPKQQNREGVRRNSEQKAG